MLNSLNRPLSAPKENSTNLEFSKCDIRLPQKKSYDVVNGLALLLTSDDLGRSKGWYWDGNCINELNQDQGLELLNMLITFQ